VRDLHLQTLEQRRRELVERSVTQRAALGAALGSLTHKAAALDRAVGAVRRYPLISVAVAGAVVLLGGRRLFSLVARGLTLYALLRKI